MDKKNLFRRGAILVAMALGLTSSPDAEKEIGAVSTVSAVAKPVVKRTPVKKSKPVATDDAPIRINTREDFDRLMQKSKKYIFPELILEEVPKQRAYNDNGPALSFTVNTLELGQHGD